MDQETSHLVPSPVSFSRTREARAAQRGISPRCRWGRWGLLSYHARYDALNRLQLVKDNGVVNCGSASWRQKYIYDRYGNRALRQGSCPTAPVEGQVWVNSDLASDVENQYVDNRLPNESPTLPRHDGSGNVVRAAGNVYLYDAENRLVKAMAGGFDYFYRYNGEGKRVAVDKKNGATIVETRLFHYGADGELLAETAGMLPAAWDRKYVGVDHLGSTRLVMKASGAGEGLVDSRHDYFPFGEEVPERGVSYGDAAVKVKFTGHQSDSELGMDFMEARYFGSSLGRFTSPDIPIVFAHQDNPQTWNLYSYGLNRPTTYFDPTGHEPCENGVNPQNGNICTVVTLNKLKPGSRVPAAGPKPDVAIDNPYFYAVATGVQRAAPVVEAAAYGTAIVAGGGLLGAGYGALAGGSGIQQLGVAGAPLLPELGRKLDYLFGLAKGSLHNLQRSGAMLNEMKRIGLHDTPQSRAYVQNHLAEVLNDTASIVSQAGGRTVRESFLAGPNGGVKIESIWEGTKLITVKVFGGAK